MFELEQAIAEWRRQMVASGVKTSELLNELEAHLRDDLEHGIGSGLSAELAFSAAVQRLGRAAALRGEFAKEERARRRHFIYRGLLFGIGAFWLGAAFCYFGMIPIALASSKAYSQWLGFSTLGWNTREYMRFVCRFMLGMGLCFEMPVLVLTLVKIGVLDHRFLSQARKYVIVANLVLGAVFTTPEVITQLLMFLPLQLLFEVSVGVAWYWERQDKKREAAAGTKQG
jgi:Sec-independent protein secretion pathway component TatC